MSTIVKNIVIPENRRVTLDLPADLPTGEAVVTIQTKGKPEKRPNKLGELFGKGKGEIWMADDFDAPLEDFKEYM